MEYFKIVPTVSERGLRYEVHKYKAGYFGTKHLGALEEHGDIGYLTIELCLEGSPELFKTTKEATHFIRKHYGENARIKTWRQL